MRIALFYYDGFSEFEVALIGLFFKEHDFMTIALENREYRSEECQRFVVDNVVKDVDLQSIDLFVIPGGDPAPLVDNLELKDFVDKLIAKNKKVAGICGGASLLAGLGALKGKKCTGMSSGRDPNRPSFQYFSESFFSDEHVVVDGNIITAQGQAYVEFAVELARQMSVCDREDDYQEALKWFRNLRD